MKTSYRGSGPTFRVVHETEDGRRWREATPKELAEIGPDALVFMGRGEPHPASDYTGYCFAGGYPFLPALAALLPVYVEETSDEKEDR